MLPSDSATEQNWTTKLVSELWIFGVDCWKSCNQYMYGATNEKTTMKLSSEVGNAVSALNASSDKVAPTECHLFLLPSHVCLCHHRKAQKLQWVNTLELLLHAWDQCLGSMLEIPLFLLYLAMEVSSDLPNAGNS